jgi:hypothetical protein
VHGSKSPHIGTYRDGVRLVNGSKKDVVTHRSFVRMERSGLEQDIDHGCLVPECLQWLDLTLTNVLWKNNDIS